MNFFINDVMAEGAAASSPAAAGSPFSSLIMLGVLFAIFYFLLIRPQAKRAKEHKAMVEALAKGDEAVTNGGTLGRITEVGDQFITLEIDNGVSIKVQRGAIQSIMPKGTIKSA